MKKRDVVLYFSEGKTYRAVVERVHRDGTVSIELLNEKRPGIFDGPYLYTHKRVLQSDVKMYNYAGLEEVYRRDRERQKLKGSGG